MEEKKAWYEENLIEIAPNSLELQIKVPADVITPELEEILADFARKAKIPGFRVGKVPRDIVRRVFAAQIRERIIDKLVPRAVNESLQGHRLQPAVGPEIQDIHWEEGQPLTFRVRIDVWPDFKLPDYRAIKVSPPPVEVQEEEIDRALSELQQRATEFIPVNNRGLQPGDYALLEIRARDLKKKKMQPPQKIQFQAGHPENDPKLEEKILGLIPGETRVFISDYPADHSDPNLAPRQMEYTVKILALREKRVPEISDDFARSLGNFDNLEELKQKIKEELTEKKKEESRRQVAETILNKIRDEVSLTLPEAAVEEESHVILRRWFASQPERKWEEAELKTIETEARTQAEKRLKERLILERIAEKERIVIRDEELEEEVRSLAKSNRISYFELKERLDREGRMEALRHNLLLRKVVDFLVAQAL